MASHLQSRWNDWNSQRKESGDLTSRMIVVQIRFHFISVEGQVSLGKEPAGLECIVHAHFPFWGALKTRRWEFQTC